MMTIGNTIKRKALLITTLVVFPSFLAGPSPLAATLLASTEKPTPAAAQFFAAALQGDLQVIRHFLEAGTDINLHESSTGVTALINSSGSGHLIVVEFLLSKNASIDDVDKTGQSALMVAAGKGRAAVVELLLNKHANACLLSDNGMSARQLAARNRLRDKSDLGRAGYAEVLRALQNHLPSSKPGGISLASACQKYTAAAEAAGISFFWLPFYEVNGIPHACREKFDEWQSAHEVLESCRYQKRDLTSACHSLQAPKVTRVKSQLDWCVSEAPRELKRKTDFFRGWLRTAIDGCELDAILDNPTACLAFPSLMMYEGQWMKDVEKELAR